MKKFKVLIFAVFFLLAIPFISATTNDAGVFLSFDDADLSGSNPTDKGSLGLNWTNGGADTGFVGRPNEAFDFVASNTDSVTNTDTNTLELYLRDDYSISFWFNADSIANYGIISYPDRDISIQLDHPTGNDKIMLQHFDGLTTYRVYTTTTFSSGQWYHVVIVRDDGTNVKFYVDGSLDNTASNVVDATTTTDFPQIGRQITTKYMDGFIDSVAMYNRTLDLSEVQELYNSGLGFDPFSISNTTIQAYDNSSLEQILNFNATVNGTLYQTTNGTILLPYDDTTDYLVNITMNADGYLELNYTNYNISNDLVAYLTPELLNDFALLTPNNTKTNATTYNITWTEAISPTSKAVTYNVSIYDGNDILVESDTTTSLSYLLNLSTYNADIYNITVTAEEDVTGTNYSHSSYLYFDALNYVYFKDAINSSALTNQDITVLFSNNDEVDYTTDSLGKIELPSFIGTTFVNGTTNITYKADQGYVTPITFTYIATDLPYNITYNISRANLTIRLYDALTNDLITENISISITGIGTFTTVTGILVQEDMTITSDTYTVITTSENYTYTQKEFTFTNQENITVDLFLYNKATANIGTLYVEVYDSFYDIVVGADLRLQELDTVTSSFVETSQSTTDSNGQASFQVLLEGKTYRVLATKNGNSEYSTDAGAIIYTDESLIRIYLNTIVDHELPADFDIQFNVTNTTLINNISYHRINFYDPNGLTWEVCLGYYRVDTVIESLSLEVCENISSGTINYGGGYLLNRDNTYDVRGYIKNRDGSIDEYYSQVYSSDTDFENTFAFIIEILIIISIVVSIGMMLYGRGRIDIFCYLQMIFSFIWAFLTPSYYSGLTTSILIIFSIIVLNMAKKRGGSNDV